MRSNKIVSVFIVTVLLLLPVFGFAATPAPDEKAANYNMLLISLVGLIVILLFVIGMLANTLRQLSVSVKEKIRAARKDGGNITKTVLLLLALSLPALHTAAAETAAAAKVEAPAPTSISGIPIGDYYAIMAMIIFELIIILALAIFIRVLVRSIMAKPELTQEEKAAIVQKSWFWDKFNRAVPVEKEKDLLLDHNYDGIRELDNSLPPWWIYGFYLTIIVAVIYLYRFHVSHDGLSQTEEYAVEMQKGEEDKAAYLAQSANNVDENSVVLLTDAASISAGHEIFAKNCVACHLPDGGGVVGPNLTDDYWLHGGSIKDIFKTIKYGWQDKGMKSWKDDLSPKDIQLVASFVKSLRGTHPATPKAPQGDLYIEASTAGKTGDSTKVITDSTAKAK